jgi:hypothetical protein
MPTPDAYRLMTAAAMLGLPAAAPAQIAYSDLDPDVDLTGAGSWTPADFSIDLDADSVPDLLIRADYAGTYDHYVGASGLYGVELAGKTKPESFICEGARRSPFRAEADRPLDGNQTEWIQKGHLVRLTGGPCVVGFWDVGQTGFLGVRVPVDSGYRYGWVRLRPTGTAGVRILDHALQLTPNRSIRAGESPACPSPGAPSAATGADGTLFHWSGAPEHAEYALELARASDGAVRTFVTDTPSVRAGRLDTTDAYTWTVRARCADGLISPEAEGGGIAPARLAAPAGDALRVFPNPARGIVRVEHPGSGAGILVLDGTGRERAACRACSALTLDVRDWPAGINLVRSGGVVRRLLVTR